MQIPVKSNYRKIHPPLPGNPLATIGNPLVVIGKLPTIGKLIIEAVNATLSLSTNWTFSVYIVYLLYCAIEIKTDIVLKKFKIIAFY